MKKEKRDLKFNFHKGGSGSFTPRMSVPKKWADEMGITRENPNIVATFEGDRIIIEKAKNEWLFKEGWFFLAFFIDY